MLTAASSSSSSSMPRMLRDYSIFDETDEGIVVVDDDDDDCDESVDYAAALCNTTDTTMEHGSAEATTDGDPTEDQQRDDTDKRSSLLQQPVPGTGSSSSMTGDFSLFRDFFLAAFSDGYYSNMACCGGIGGNNNNRDGLFETNESFCLPGRFSSARIAPLTALPSSDDQETKIHPTCDNISNSSIMDNARNAQQQQSSAACGPDSDLHLIASASSHESCSSSQQHQHPTHRLKKRPLAVAVGYKYAEDMNGRPIVITPQRRSLSPALYNTAHRTALIPSSSSPVAHRDTQTVDNWNNFFSSGTTIAYLFSSTGEPSTEERQLSQRQEQC